MKEDKKTQDRKLSSKYLNTRYHWDRAQLNTQVHIDNKKKVMTITLNKFTALIPL